MALLNASYKKDINTIYTAANSTKEIRSKLKEQINKNDKKLILVYLNFSDKVLLERINNSERKKNNKNHTGEFTDLLLNKQSIRYEKPNPNEADFFFEIQNERDFETVEKEIIKLVR
jgi:gluconate kinase